MDIGDRGPTLNAGNYAMRVTNVGILGNAFSDVGLSFDPSFEYPRGTGHECLKHADLWVGALDELGHGRVSGGPELEWRPTLDPADRVRVGVRGRTGSRRGVDDDGDGKVDEEIFNGRDDDGDGEVDEDVGFPSDEVTAADYTDDQPAAINYGYPNGERHQPFGLSVHQEAYAWALPGYDTIAGVQFTITNHGGTTLRQIYVGLLADLDSRGRDDPLGHTNDLIVYRTASRSFNEGSQVITVGGLPARSGACFTSFKETFPVVVDGDPNSGLPAIAVVGLGHTTDPLAQIENVTANNAARAPGRESFRFSVFRLDLPPGQGGVPLLDQDRYDALSGSYPVTTSTLPGDQVVLLSCGPFPLLEPGQSIEFAVALVAAPNADSLATHAGSAAFLYHGTKFNLLPDVPGTDFMTGESGKNGHEVCLEPPPGVEFDFDPNCPANFAGDATFPPEASAHYSHGHCVWTNADCNACTGVGGFETIERWLDPGSVPPAPGYHVVPGDHQVRITWDNQPEILLKAGVAGAGGYSFSGYRIYRLSDWKRESLLPPPDHWELISAFSTDTLNSEKSLAAVTDSTVDYDFVRFAQKHYPIGRYGLTDTQVLNGFDYLYLVTTVAQRTVTLLGGGTKVERIESPVTAVIDSVVVPHVAASGGVAGVWVVPNPYRAHADWDRPPIRGDPFGRHIDFMGLPRGHSTIKIWTVAGDFVAQLVHDGSQGDGQAPWNLISRNGQDVESGIYLFTVDSPQGHATGRFVVVR